MGFVRKRSKYLLYFSQFSIRPKWISVFHYHHDVNNTYYISIFYVLLSMYFNKICSMYLYMQ